MSGVSYKSLGDALARLREALMLLDAHHADGLHVSMRNSVLLSFQFTYRLCRPMIERFLVNEGDDPLEVQEMSYSTLIRSATAAEFFGQTGRYGTRFAKRETAWRTLIANR